MSTPAPTPRTWPDVERVLAALPRRAVAGFAAASARRTLPDILRLSEAYGPEAAEWHAAAEDTVRAVEAYARGDAVTRFRLDLAADAARCAAAATANAARLLGPSPLVEAAELAYAAAAYAADAARAPTPERAAALAARAATMATNGGDPTAEQLAALAAVSR